MDSGELDFYQHSKVCSNTCRSTKIDLVGAKMSSDPSNELVSASPSVSGRFQRPDKNCFLHTDTAYKRTI